MTTFLSSAAKMIARTSLATAFGIALLGGTANADNRSEHAKQMSLGKDHYQVLSTLRFARPVTDAPVSAAGTEHAKAMSKGKDHYAAPPIAATGAPEGGTSQAAKHASKMSQGKDHYAQ